MMRYGVRGGCMTINSYTMPSLPHHAYIPQVTAPPMIIDPHCHLLVAAHEVDGKRHDCVRGG